MLNRMVPIPYSYLYYTWRNRQNNFCIFFKILDFFENRQKKSGKTPAWGALPPRKYIQCWIEWYQPPTRIFTIREEIDKTIFVFFFKFLDFFQKSSKKVGKTKNPAWGAIPLGSTFNAESNGTNPHSYLYYTWRNRQNNFCVFFSKF